MWYSSKSRIPTFFAVLALVLGSFAIAGCGDDDDTTSGAGATAAATGETGDDVTPEVTGATGESEENTDTAATGEPDDGGVGVESDGGAGDEEAARTPVTITAVGNRFSAGTAREVHVPSFIAIELDVTVKGGASRTLVVARGNAKRTHTFPGGKRTTLQLEGLRPERTLTVSLGGDRITVVADAEPGP